jgi:hypothetical protein
MPELGEPPFDPCLVVDCDPPIPIDPEFTIDPCLLIDCDPTIPFDPGFTIDPCLVVDCTEPEDDGPVVNPVIPDITLLPLLPVPSPEPTIIIPVLPVLPHFHLTP